MVVVNVERQNELRKCYVGFLCWNAILVSKIHQKNEKRKLFRSDSLFDYFFLQGGRKHVHTVRTEYEYFYA